MQMDDTHGQYSCRAKSFPPTLNDHFEFPKVDKQPTVNKARTIEVLHKLVNYNRNGVENSYHGS